MNVERIAKIGEQMSSMMHLTKAAALYAESIRSEKVSFEYKNICTSIIRNHKLLEDRIKFMNPHGKEAIDNTMDDEKIHYISEVVLLMSMLNSDGCKEILEVLKKNID